MEELLIRSNMERIWNEAEFEVRAQNLFWWTGANNETPQAAQSVFRQASVPASSSG